MGCRKLSYYQEPRQIGKNHFFIGEPLEKRGTGHFFCNDYYPFGLPIADSNYEEPGNETNRFKFQGKEWQTALSLNLYDFHARQYDPAIGRFTGIDPQGQFASGYVGMGNQPTIGVDPNGEWLHILIGAIVGGIVNVAANWGDIGGNFWEFQKAWNLGAAVGATAALAGGAASNAVLAAGNTATTAGGGALGFGAGFTSGAAGGAAGGFVGGAGNSWINGGSFSDGLRAGGFGALAGGVTGGILGGIGGARNLRALRNYKPSVNYLNRSQLPRASEFGSLSANTSSVPRIENSVWGAKMLNNVTVRAATRLNAYYASTVQVLAGTPYELGSNGPDSYDCSSTVCYGIRETDNAGFGDYTADELYRNYTRTSTSQSRGNLTFYDWDSDGVIDHVTTILGENLMSHPSGNSGILLNTTRTYLDGLGGTRYHAEIIWNLIRR